MPYTPQQWNNQDPSTPLSGPRMNKLETQYGQAMSDVAAQIAGATGGVHTALEARLSGIVAGGSNGLDFTKYGIKPVVSYTGTVWEARSTRLPPGYLGTVEFDSTGYLGAPSPTDMVAGDKWDRQVA